MNISLNMQFDNTGNFKPCMCLVHPHIHTYTWTRAHNNVGILHYNLVCYCIQDSEMCCVILHILQSGRQLEADERSSSSVEIKNPYLQFIVSLYRVALSYGNRTHNYTSYRR